MCILAIIKFLHSLSQNQIYKKIYQIVAFVFGFICLGCVCYNVHRTVEDEKERRHEEREWKFQKWLFRGEKRARKKYVEDDADWSAYSQAMSAHQGWGQEERTSSTQVWGQEADSSSGWTSPIPVKGFGIKGKGAKAGKDNTSDIQYNDSPTLFFNTEAEFQNSIEMSDNPFSKGGKKASGKKGGAIYSPQFGKKGILSPIDLSKAKGGRFSENITTEFRSYTSSGNFGDDGWSPLTAPQYKGKFGGAKFTTKTSETSSFNLKGKGGREKPNVSASSFMTPEFGASRAPASFGSNSLSRQNNTSRFSVPTLANPELNPQSFSVGKQQTDINSQQKLFKDAAPPRMEDHEWTEQSTAYWVNQDTPTFLNHFESTIGSRKDNSSKGSSAKSVRSILKTNSDPKVGESDDAKKMVSFDH